MTVRKHIYVLGLSTAMGLAMAAPSFAQAGGQNPSAQPGQPQAQPPGAQGQSGSAGADITVRQPPADVTVQQPAPQVTVQQPAPTVTIQQPEPKVTVEQPKPDVTVQQAKPDVSVQQQGQPNVRVQQSGQPDVNVVRPGQNRGETASGTAGPATSASGPFAAMRAEQLIGKDVYGSQGEQIGEIEDIVINKQGKAKAALLDVGGFLGIGGKRVAVPFDRLNMQGDRIIAGMSKDQIRGLPEYNQAEWERFARDRVIGDAS